MRLHAFSFVFFYGDVAYRPRYHEFLRTQFADYARLAFCPRCLVAQPSICASREHTSVCALRHPPGTLIYEENELSVWEVHGAKEKV